MDAHGVTGALVLQNAYAGIAGRFPVCFHIKGQHGAELFAGKRNVMPDLGLAADEHAGVLGNADPCQRSNVLRRLSDDPGIHRSVGPHENGGYLLLFLRGQNVSALACQLVEDGITDALLRDNGLLRGAYGAVIKGLGIQNALDRQRYVGGALDERGAVSGADADGRRTGGICGLHHGGAAGGEDQVGFLHQLRGALHRQQLHAADGAGRAAGTLRRLPHNARGLRDGGLRAGMRGENDGVSCLQRDLRLIDDGRGRVGGRNKRSDHAHRHADLQDLLFRILAEDADGFHVADGLIDGTRGKAVFYGFVLWTAEAGLLLRHAAEPLSVFLSGLGDGLHDRVDLRLREGGKLALRFSGPADQAADRLDRL